MDGVILIGRGRIGAPVATWLGARGRLGAVLGRDATRWQAAPLAIDAAGPEALRQYGERLLAEGDLWTVGAAALADDAFRSRMERIASETGHHLRLFTGWIGGTGIVRPESDASLHVVQSAPGLAPFDGPLSEAVLRFPDHLNTACATALCGPGIARTTLALQDAGEGAPHRIEARLTLPDSVLTSSVTFHDDPSLPHPVASAIIAALERANGWLTYG